jgi:hypothetical protein
LREPDEPLGLFEEPPDDRLPAEDRELPPDGRLRLTDDRELPPDDLLLPTEDRELPPDGRLLPTDERELPPEDRELPTERDCGAEYRRLRLLPTDPRDREVGARTLDDPDGGVDGRL